MTKQERFRGQAALCMKSAQTTNDPTYKLVLLDLARWWSERADHAETLQTQPAE